MERRKRLGPGRRSLDRGSTFSAEPTPLKRETELKRTGLEAKADQPRARPRPRPISEATPAQRLKTRDAACVACRRPGPCDPMHVIDRGQLSDPGQDDALAVVPGCRSCHRLYDTGHLDLLPHLEPHYRAELAFAVSRFGLLATLRRVTNDRWESVRPPG